MGVQRVHSQTPVSIVKESHYFYSSYGSGQIFFYVAPEVSAPVPTLLKSNPKKESKRVSI
jgi:hypothetical protein